MISFVAMVVGFGCPDSMMGGKTLLTVSKVERILHLGYLSTTPGLLAALYILR